MHARKCCKLVVGNVHPLNDITMSFNQSSYAWWSWSCTSWLDMNVACCFCLYVLFYWCFFFTVPSPFFFRIRVTLLIWHGLLWLLHVSILSWKLIMILMYIISIGFHYPLSSVLLVKKGFLFCVLIVGS